MDESTQRPWGYDASFYVYPWRDPRLEARRAVLLRRLRLLLVAGLAVFSLAVWALVRVENPLEQLGLVSGPKRVVRAHLEALSRGEAQAAYRFFSDHYREEIPYPAYERLVATHREMFRTRVVELRDKHLSEGRAVLDTRLLAANGESYMARFTLVHLAGRWWIDSIRWAQAPDPGRLSST